MKHQQCVFPTRDSANTNLLISWILSHDACIVLVSDKILFTLRERVSQARDGFQITTWHCRTLRDVFTFQFTVSLQSQRKTNNRRAHRAKGTDRRRRTKNCLHCPAKTRRQQRENKTTPLCRLRTPAQGRVCSPHKTVYLKTGARQHKDVRGSVSSCSFPLCGRNTKLPYTPGRRVLKIDSQSHWTLHDNVSHAVQCETTTGVLSHEYIIIRETDTGIRIQEGSADASGSAE